MLSKFSRLWNTVKYLRFQQIYSRVRKKLIKPKHVVRPAPPVRESRASARSGSDFSWQTSIAGAPLMLGPHRFRFLNEEHEIATRQDAYDEKLSHLWRYHLHYFDDLNAVGANDRRGDQAAWIARWMQDFPPAAKDAWDPYPTSLRIVNWIKAGLNGMAISSEMRESLAAQVRWLAQSLEFHLLGNHLLANAKALLFAAMYFEGSEADRWLKESLAIYDDQLSEQILADGGHFELSPMYHCTILEDLLDVYNLARAVNDPELLKIAERVFVPRIQTMRHWLQAMLHPDGQISFFNDAALDHAPHPRHLEDYAIRLGLGPTPEIPDGLTWLESSGYVRVQFGKTVLIADVARIGPDYIPGHAHADTLTFELSINGKRAIVNSGTSCYGNDAQRHHERSTAAHNTVEVDGANSSEVWGGFRVARRARPRDLEIEMLTNDIFKIRCSHDGYRRLRGKVTHTRTWLMQPTTLQVTDELDGKYHEAIGRIHLAPEWANMAEGRSRAPSPGSAMFLPDGLPIQFVNEGEKLSITLHGKKNRLEPETYHPRFGESAATHCIASEFPAVLDNRKIACSLELRWE